MPFDVKGIPRETCHYKHDRRSPVIMQAECNDVWIVLQEDFQYCPFCGKTVERNPPQKPRIVA